MANSTAPVTYISKTPSLRVDRHKFKNHLLTTRDADTIKELDARIAKGGRCSFARQEAKAEPKAPKDDNSGGEKIDWEKFTKADLQAHATKAGVTGVSSMNKPDIIDALNATEYRPY